MMKKAYTKAEATKDDLRRLLDHCQIKQRNKQ